MKLTRSAETRWRAGQRRVWGPQNGGNWNLAWSARIG